MTCRCRVRTFFSTGSLILTAASLAVGISFFAPYWLNNLQYGSDSNQPYVNGSVSQYSSRGLWAQCGAQCQWFWQYNYQLQTQKFTPLKWHLATQVMYFVAATLILLLEIYARVQMCCAERPSVFISLGIIALISVVLQTASLATFGAGASKYPYNAISNPSLITQMVSGSSTANQVYLGWTFWMAFVGDVITFIAAIFFFLAACCAKRNWSRINGTM